MHDESVWCTSKKKPRSGPVYGYRPMRMKHCSVSCARIYRPSFHENKPKTLVFSHTKRSFWACFRENWVYNFGHCTAASRIRSIRFKQFGSVSEATGSFFLSFVLWRLASKIMKLLSPNSIVAYDVIGFFILSRQYWMIYRGQGFLAFVCSPPPLPSVSSTSGTQEDRERETTCFLHRYLSQRAEISLAESPPWCPTEIREIRTRDLFCGIPLGYATSHLVFFTLSHLMLKMKTVLIRCKTTTAPD